MNLKKTFFGLWQDKLLSADNCQKNSFWQKIREYIAIADLI